MFPRGLARLQTYDASRAIYVLENATGVALSPVSFLTSSACVLLTLNSLRQRQQDVRQLRIALRTNDNSGRRLFDTGAAMHLGPGAGGCLRIALLRKAGWLPLSRKKLSTARSAPVRPLTNHPP